MSTVLDVINPGQKNLLSFTAEELQDRLPAEAHEVTEKFNETFSREDLDTDTIRKLDAIFNLHTVAAERGIQYALLADKDSSREDAILAFSPFGHDFDLNVGTRILYRAEYMRRLAKAVGITDNKGDSLPVLAVSSPAGRSTLMLSAEDKKTVAKGDLAPVSREHLRLAKINGFGRVALLGWSLGGSFAASAAAEASRNDLDATHLVVGDPPNVKRRSRLSLAWHNSTEKGYDIEAAVSGIDALARSFEYFSMKSLTKAIVNQGKQNLAIASAIGRDSLGDMLKKAAEANVISTLIHAEHSKVAPKEAIENTYIDVLSWQLLNRQARPIVDLPLLKKIEIKGARHAFADRVNAWAALGCYAISRNR